MIETGKDERDADLAFVVELDRLSLEQALLDFEVANARVVDLSRRLTNLNRELSSALIKNGELAAELQGIRTIQRTTFFKVYRVLRGGWGIIGSRRRAPNL